MAHRLHRHHHRRPDRCVRAVQRERDADDRLLADSAGRRARHDRGGRTRRIPHVARVARRPRGSELPPAARPERTAHRTESDRQHGRVIRDRDRSIGAGCRTPRCAGRPINQARRSNRPRSQAPLPPAKCPPPFYSSTRTRRRAAPPKTWRPRNDDANARRHGLMPYARRTPITTCAGAVSSRAATAATLSCFALCNNRVPHARRTATNDSAPTLSPRAARREGRGDWRGGTRPARATAGLTGARLACREARGVRRARRAHRVRDARPGAAAPTAAGRSARPHQHSRCGSTRLQRLSRSGHGGDSADERAGRSRGRQHAVARTRRDRRRLDRRENRYVRHVLDAGRIIELIIGLWIPWVMLVFYATNDPRR